MIKLSVHPNSPTAVNSQNIDSIMDISNKLQMTEKSKNKE